MSTSSGMSLEDITKAMKRMNEANTSNDLEEVAKQLSLLKAEVKPTEELLKASKLGLAVGKFRQHPDKKIEALAKEIVKLWREAVDVQKRQKRQREEDTAEGSGSGAKAEDGVKRVKTEAGSSKSPGAAAAGTATPPKSESKPKVKDEKPDGEGGGRAAGEDSSDFLSTIDTALKKPRTAKGDQIGLKADDNGGDDIRDKCLVLIYDALVQDSNASSSTVSERARSIERAIYDLMNANTGNDYRSKVRSLSFNIKAKDNATLRHKIVVGSIPPDYLVNMSPADMATDKIKAMNEKITMDNLFKAKAVGETEAETDAFKCGRCQERKCTYYQMQTRSADEPMTTFVTCKNCGNRWKFS